VNVGKVSSVKFSGIMFRRVRHRNVGEPFLVYGENATIGWVFVPLGAAWQKK